MSDQPQRDDSSVRLLAQVDATVTAVTSQRDYLLVALVALRAVIGLLPDDSQAGGELAFVHRLLSDVAAGAAVTAAGLDTALREFREEPAQAPPASAPASDASAVEAVAADQPILH